MPLHPPPDRRSGAELDELDLENLHHALTEKAIWTGGYGPSFERCMRLWRLGYLRPHPSYGGCALVITEAGLVAIERAMAGRRVA